MFKFDELKDKVLATAGSVADKSVEMAKMAGDKAKVIAKLTRLNTELAKEKETLRRTYTEMGKIYYEQHKNSPDESMIQAVADVEHSLQKMEVKRQEIETLKSELSVSGEEYVDYVDAEEDDSDLEDVASGKNTTDVDSASDEKDA